MATVKAIFSPFVTPAMPGRPSSTWLKKHSHPDARKCGQLTKGKRTRIALRRVERDSSSNSTGRQEDTRSKMTDLTEAELEWFRMVMPPRSWCKLEMWDRLLAAARIGILAQMHGRE